MQYMHITLVGQLSCGLPLHLANGTDFMLSASVSGPGNTCCIWKQVLASCTIHLT